MVLMKTYLEYIKENKEEFNIEFEEIYSAMPGKYTNREMKRINENDIINFFKKYTNEFFISFITWEGALEGDTPLSCGIYFKLYDELKDIMYFTISITFDENYKLYHGDVIAGWDTLRKNDLKQLYFSKDYNSQLLQLIRNYLEEHPEQIKNRDELEDIKNIFPDFNYLDDIIKQTDWS